VTMIVMVDTTIIKMTLYNNPFGIKRFVRTLGFLTRQIFSQESWVIVSVMKHGGNKEHYETMGLLQTRLPVSLSFDIGMYIPHSCILLFVVLGSFFTWNGVLLHFLLYRRSTVQQHTHTRTHRFIPPQTNKMTQQTQKCTLHFYYYYCNTTTTMLLRLLVH
jgi:hypothetical protein